MKLYEIKADHMKNIDYLHVKILANTSTKPSSYYEQQSNKIYIYSKQPSTDLIK